MVGRCKQSLVNQFFVRHEFGFIHGKADRFIRLAGFPLYDAPTSG
jgi:hypothetical protein